MFEAALGVAPPLFVAEVRFDEANKMPAVSVDRVRLDPAGAAAMADAGRRYATDHLSWSACAQAFAEVYGQVLPTAQGNT